MDMVLSKEFVELSMLDSLYVEGGGKLLDGAMAAAGVYGAGVSVLGAIGTTSLSCAATCAAIASTPVVATTAAVCGVIAAGYGIYTLVS